MKKRLLFWVNGFMLHFGLAYYLQQKLDDDFYAIIDVSNNPKKMFLNQKIVNFQKTWYFHDNIKKTTVKPDLNYLSNFEKKYQIDLWKLAINERHFYRFNRFYKFSTNEILQFLEQECKLFEQILDEVKPEYFLTYDPVFHHQKLLLDVCRAKGIKVLCLFIARMGGRSIIAEDGSTFDLPQNLDLVELSEDEKTNLNFRKNMDEYVNISKKWVEDFRLSNVDKLKAVTAYITSSDSQNTRSNFTYYGRNKLKVLQDNISMIIKRKFRSRYMKNMLKGAGDVDLDVPFVYFPMNIEEEINLLHYSPFFTNQIEVIRHVAKSLPIDYKLYLKDHIHSVFRGWRDKKEYQEIMDIPNTTLIHPSYSSKELIKHSKLVITIRGTAAIEAAFENKPAIIFGDTSFSILPSVYKMNSLEKLPDLIRESLKTPIDPVYLQKYLKLMNDRTINFDIMSFENKRNNHFYSGRILSDVNISENSMKEFLEKYKNDFEILVNAHLTKINASKV